MEPVTRKEQFLSAIAGESENIPTPITREELWLKKIYENGGSGDDKNLITKETIGNTRISYLNDISILKNVIHCTCVQKEDGSVDVETEPNYSSSGPYFDVNIDTTIDNIIEFSVKGLNGQVMPEAMKNNIIVNGSTKGLGVVSLVNNKYVRKITKREIEAYGITSPLRIGLIVPSAMDDVMTYNVSVKNIGDGITVSDTKKKCFYPLNGIKVIFLGDSITAFNNEQSWVNNFCDLTSCIKLQNVAVAKAVSRDFENTVLDGNPTSSVQSNNTLCNQVQKIINNNYEEPDLIIIAIGTNDGIITTEENIKKSYISDGAPVSLDDLDRTTNEGAFRWVNEKLRDLYPNAMIIWCNPIQGANKTPESVTTWAENLRMLTNYGAVENVTTNRCGISWATERVNHVFLVDGLHPNAKGAMKIALYNASAITAVFYVKTQYYQQAIVDNIAYASKNLADFQAKIAAL